MILVRLSDVADIRAEEELKTAVTHGAKTNTYTRFHLHTIIFYYKGPEQGGDNGWAFLMKRFAIRFLRCFKSSALAPLSRTKLRNR